MKNLWLAMAVVLASGAHADVPGAAVFSIDVTHHDRELTGIVYFPTASNLEPENIGGNPVFLGVDVMPNAVPARGQYPVVLLSHGFGGTVRSLSWLAHGLADRGAIVISVNHPNSTLGDFDIARGTEHWTRARDLSAALDYLEEHPDFQGSIDPTRIMAAGFSFGGWTALSLGGVRGNLEGYIAHCDRHPARSAHCADMVDGSVALVDFSRELWNADYSDARVTHVAAIDPGLIWGLRAEDVANATGNIRLVALGSGSDRLFAANFDQSGLPELLPDAGIHRIAPASHFSALQACTPIGAEILAEEGEPPVCTDPEGTDRQAVHALIISLVAADLGL